MAQPEDTMDAARDPQVGRDEQQEQQKRQSSEVGMAQEPNGSLEVPSLAAEREPELDALEELERTHDLEVNRQPDNDTAQVPMSAAHSMQEIPLDSPGEEDPPVVPVKSPTLPATPRVGSTPRNSLSVHSSSRHHRSLTLSRGQTVSSVLITSALDIILESREARKSVALKDATQRALDMINAENDELIDSRVLFEPLRLACETRSEKLMVASLDCISKLISYSFFTDSAPPQHDTLPLPDLIVHTITSAYTETTSDAVSLQIVKSLLALVLSNSVVVHHSSLLKAVRTIYNVFLLSQNSSNQLVAQGGLTQMIHHVFSRCKAKSSSFQSEENLSSTVSDRPSTPSTVPMAPTSTITIPSAGSVEEAKKHLPEVADTSMETPTEETASHRADQEQLGVTVQKSVNLPSTPPPNDLDNEKVLRNLSLEDMFIKDAYLVFRALCKLSMKPLITESERDLKSHGMRSKLLSLYLLNTILTSYMPVFLEPTSLLYSGSSGDATHFLDAAKQYLCLAISRNAVSSVPQVFELSVDMFWRVLSEMRSRLKKEIEVLLHEIFIPTTEMRTSTWKHKSIMLQMLSRLSQDGQALVDLYINYDCDSEALENIYERIINVVSKISAAKSDESVVKASGDGSSQPNPKSKDPREIVPPSLSTTALSTPTSAQGSSGGGTDISLRRQALECLVSVLRSLVAWGTTTERSGPEGGDKSHAPKQVDSIGPQRNGITNGSSERLSISHELSRVSTPDIIDDPSRFESAKQKKTLLTDGIKKFNFKPKKGIQFLIEAGFIPPDDKVALARFLMTTEGLNKAMIGEYLGEGEDDNIATMHIFVDLLDFTGLNFTGALRMFLQSFRLPGESQKIDRFMLKFAERYIACNTETVFKNGEAAYVLAYSTIMLNTDAHNPQVKHRMTRAEFIRNNRGINDGTDLPEDLLDAIFDEIQLNEIRMKDEVEHGPVLPMSSATPGFANLGKNIQKEAYITQATGMMSRTEAMFRTMTRNRNNSQQFFSATHFHHVKPMFEVAWMAFLAGLSGPLQETNDLEIVELCLDGFKSSIHIVCFFDLELQRTSFITTLANFTFLNNLGEMKAKNMEAIKALLDVSVNEGNNLKSCWRDVLMCVSQLERMQLISGRSETPDKRSRKKLPAEELANESRSTHITVAADMVFSLSHYLSGTAIVDFVQALSDISWDEIQSSGMSETPRLFSLQKLVEISYYNMGRIRMEWANIWAILGQHFNQICCHANPHVAFFALDALRQLAMRFLEKEELSHFRFQKDFLRPFEHTMYTPADNALMTLIQVLQCLQQMIQARVHNMRSGWRTMFGVFSAAARVPTEHIATTAFEIVTSLNRNHFEAIVRNGAFADMTVCITDFCKASRYQKISLLAIGMLRKIIPTMLQSAECMLPSEPSPDPSISNNDDPTIKFWFPVLFSFFDIIMNGEDLEVRQMALESLFSTLKTYGPSFSEDFWDNIFRELIFPIFAVLKSASDVSRFSTQDDMAVWFSTTMVEALRNVIDLYSHHFDLLGRTFNGLLDLLSTCVCQENDTIARIGTSCFQKLVESNVDKLSGKQWEQVTTSFVKLFRVTTPHQLFDESLRADLSSNPSNPPESPVPTSSALLPAPLAPEAPIIVDSPNPVQARRRIFQQIITKCILQRLLIETTSELFQNKVVYETMPPEQLLRWTGVLDHSYQFAHSFNEDKDLRTGLWRVGFMKQLPNLLQQESASASTLINVLLRMYFDTRPDHQASKQQVADHMLPLGLSIMRDYIKLKPESNQKMMTAWTPVITVLLDGFSRFDDPMFSRYLPAVYPLTVDLLSRNMEAEMRNSIQAFFRRTGKVHGIVDS